MSAINRLGGGLLSKRWWGTMLMAAGLFIAWSPQAATLAKFRMPVGDVTVELLDEDKPATVKNFLRYVEEGRYKDMFIHRWVPNFVIQGGGFMVTNRSTANEVFDRVPVYERIVNEYSVGKTYSNTYGTLAMARVGGDTNSATSQWFFNLKNNSELDKVDGGFTVFGRVVAGTNVLNLFIPQPPVNKIYGVNAGSPLNELPVLKPSPSFDDLVFVNIDIARPVLLDVRRAAGQPASIQWLSQSNWTYRVEYTTQIPAVWKSLVQTNGTGLRITVTDPAVDPARFYRVQIAP